MPLYGHFCSFFFFFPNIFDVGLWLGVDQHWSTFIDILLLNVWYRSSAGSANTGNEPAFSFCTLVKFTSYFIQRELYSTVTHTYTRRCTGPTSFSYDSAKKIALKKKKKEINTNVLTVCSLGNEDSFVDSKRSQKVKRNNLWTVKIRFLQSNELEPSHQDVHLPRVKSLKRKGCVWHFYYSIPLV